MVTTREQPLRIAKAWPLVLLTSCSEAVLPDSVGTGSSGVGLSEGTAGDSGDSTEGVGASESGAISTGPAGCDPTCEDECVGGQCCPSESVCGDTCCGEGEVCSFQECVVPGVECVDASECTDDEYCEYSLGEPGEPAGAQCSVGSLATGKCLPAPPKCPPGTEPTDEQIDCLPQCEVIPTGGFTPTMKYHWEGGESMMAPVVIQLDDDNCDNIVDERDVPEIVLSTFVGSTYTFNGTLHAVSIVDGEVVTKWSVNPTTPQLHPGYSLAAGNIDNTVGNEIVACSVDGRTMAFDADGKLLWVSVHAQGCFMPSIADFDGDGQAEVLVESAILNGLDGSTKVSFTPQITVSAADIDGDQQLEIVGPAHAIESGGVVIASSGIAGHHHAVGDLDLDGTPEIVAIQPADHSLYIWRYAPDQPNGAIMLRSGIDINGGLPPCEGGTGGGPPTIADFDGDGSSDVGVAAGVGYAVFDGSALLDPLSDSAAAQLWLTPAVDCSSRATGSSVFDFEGDGKAEVIYGDEQFLRIYDGSTGTVLFETCNTTGTLWEYPLIADVDGDGHADIVAIANSFHDSIICPKDGSRQRGMRVFGDSEARWVRTRRVWNQHHYHVTNVDDDGSIPTSETPNWTVPGLNNFRQNVQPEGEFSAPDLVARLFPECADGYAIVVRVRNIGEASAPAGVPVWLYAGDPANGELLGTAMTSKVLYPAEAEELVFPVSDPPAALQDGEQEAWVIVDDPEAVHAWAECRTNNNVAHDLVRCEIVG